ncbi:dihydroorotate dehydrogenase-like protein [Limisalsivibrio acetivorans]|uniref:dihydroorotate dehydrogenase-like protein n=1 Tax=Limisalsivibrio acetivorans TaxID=1304888 RepID=UPI0003B7769C|nr:dihydroorotate dehydrogenase-like protein [Limisalsivibrio acetivorans]
MADLKVNYMGLELESPLILGSSTMPKTMDNVKAAADAGAGAVVLKSLFEEELRKQDGGYGDDFHPEAYEYMQSEAAVVYGAKEYLDNIKDAKKASSMPVIASVNCLGGKWWSDFASNIEGAGADALELNISFVPFDVNENPRDVEQRYVDVIKEVKSRIKIPVAVKIGQNFSSIPWTAKQIENAGADALVMFNRYYQMGIDTRTLDLRPMHFYSSEEETFKVLRWVAALSPQLDIDISASTGVHTSDAFIQQIIAGAKTVQVVSAVYQKGFKTISDILEGVSGWLATRQKTLDEVRGTAGKKNSREHMTFERIQYMKVADARYIGE